MKKLKHLPSKYQMGIDNWDLQHSEILIFIEESLKLVKRSKKNKLKELKHIIEDMQRYARIHFKYEEQKMIRLKYPKYEDHKSEHISFQAKLDEVERAIQNEYDVGPEIVAQFLKDWFLNHILVVDRELSKFVIDKKSESEFVPESLNKNAA